MNTIKMLRRNGLASLFEEVRQLAGFRSMLGGDGAIMAADSAMDELAEQTWMDRFPEGTVDVLIAEAKKRGLEVPSAY